MESMANDAAEFQREILDANLATMRELPEGYKLYYRVVHVEDDGTAHVIARYVRPGTDEILSVNLDPALMGCPHSRVEPGAYVIDEVGSDRGFLIERAITHALGVHVGYFDRRSF
jgi:hypothetical protein